jgi:hypothetical protein
MDFFAGLKSDMQSMSLKSGLSCSGLKAERKRDTWVSNCILEKQEIKRCPRVGGKNKSRGPSILC